MRSAAAAGEPFVKPLSTAQPTPLDKKHSQHLDQARLGWSLVGIALGHAYPTPSEATRLTTPSLRCWHDLIATVLEERGAVRVGAGGAAARGGAGAVGPNGEGVGGQGGGGGGTGRLPWRTHRADPHLWLVPARRARPWCVVEDEAGREWPSPGRVGDARESGGFPPGSCSSAQS